MHSRDYWLREAKRLGYKPTDRDAGELERVERTAREVRHVRLHGGDGVSEVLDELDPFVAEASDFSNDDEMWLYDLDLDDPITLDNLMSAGSSDNEDEDYGNSKASVQRRPDEVAPASGADVVNDEDADARALGSRDSQSSNEVVSAPGTDAVNDEDADARALGSRDSQSSNEVTSAPGRTR